MSFQKSHLELTLADVLQIIRGWLRQYEMANAHIRIGQAFGTLVREQVLFAIDVVEVALPSEASTATDASEVVIPLSDVPADELTPFDKRDVTEVSDAGLSNEDESSF